MLPRDVTSTMPLPWRRDAAQRPAKAGTGIEPTGVSRASNPSPVAIGDEPVLQGAQAPDDLVEDRVVALLAKGHEQVEELAQASLVGTHAGPQVGHEADALGRLQRREVLLQPVEAIALVGHPIEAGVAAIGAEPPGAAQALQALEGELLGLLAQQHALGVLDAVHVGVAQHDRHRPDAIGVLVGLGEEAALGEQELIVVDADGEHRVAALPDPRVGQLQHGLATGGLQGGPEVVCGGVGAGVLLHVRPDAVAEPLLAQVGLDHAEDGAALLVGDGVEVLGGLGRVLHLAPDGVRGREGVEVQDRKSVV